MLMLVLLSYPGCKGAGDDQASVSFECITTAVVKDDPRSPSNHANLLDCDDKENDKNGTSMHESRWRITRKRHRGDFPWSAYTADIIVIVNNNYSILLGANNFIRQIDGNMMAALNAIADSMM